jgi:Protein of unknown function (DUF742)
MSDRGDIWLDKDAGPVVRPYALTKGRTRPGRADLGLIDLVSAACRTATDVRGLGLGPEHKALIRLCQRPATVADLASEIDLPLGVVRVLLSDLCDSGLVSVVSSAQDDGPDENVIRSVLDGLRAL